MPIINGGLGYRTFAVTVGTTPTVIVPAQLNNGSSASRSGCIIQQAGTSQDVTLGGSDVVAGVGFILRKNPDSTSQPASFGEATTGAAIYGIVASSTGTVNVLIEDR